MTAISDVQIGQRFSFDVYPAAVLGNNFRDVRLEAIISARTAASYGVDIQALHANVYPTLPPGVPDDPFQYSYVRVEMKSGEFTVIGVPWIRAETIAISASGKATLVFTDVTQTDIDRILLACSSNGYSPASVNVAAA